MVEQVIDLKSSRAYQARLGKRLNKRAYWALMGLVYLFLIAAILSYLFYSKRLGVGLLSPAIIFFMPATWWKRQLSVLPVDGNTFTDRLSKDVLANLPLNLDLTPKILFDALANNWQARFIFHHLLFNPEEIAMKLEQGSAEEAKTALQIAQGFADQNQSPQIELGFIIAGLMLASESTKKLATAYNIKPEEIEAVANWLGRNLIEHSPKKAKENFGGIGRDWAFGFTPLLNKLGINISLNIINQGTHFGWLTKSRGVMSMEAAFDNHASAIALVGPLGVGKTISVYALAQRLIEGKTSQALAYHQIVSINAADITSNARGPRAIEHLLISIANEAAHAGHIILFLDDAEAFFREGIGAFDGSQILQSIVQARSVPLIVALTPNGYERLKARNQTLAGLLTPVVLQELDEAGVMRVLEDETVGLENQHKVLIAYEALTEAYRLSGRYEQDEAYPGKAVKLLEQAVAYSSNSVVSAVSVQHAVEQTKGVKVSKVGSVEASELLNLENKIHERMINQTQAVSVVSNSLRRARAGVTNPKRPIGSFLFLGPTGVGKTELAKALAATYFNGETNMIRLDMSEYQQESDVSRLLSDGKEEAKSLVLAIRQMPFSVVLLDEIEKAHPNILNLLLQLLDEGQLTDISGRTASFKDAIIIATSNAGAQFIRERVQRGEAIDSFKQELIEKLIQDQLFKPELINRFDEIVLFRPLTQDELGQVVILMLNEINETLTKQNLKLQLSDNAVKKVVETGYDPALGARPMRRTLQKAVEDVLAKKILTQEVKPGDTLTLDADDLLL